MTAKAEPLEPNVHFSLGISAGKKHMYDEAKAAFEAELNLDPAHAQGLAYQGDIALKNNAIEEAVPSFKRPPNREPTFASRMWISAPFFANRKSTGKPLPQCSTRRNSIPLSPMPTTVWRDCTGTWETRQRPNGSSPKSKDSTRSPKSSRGNC